jgi:hypothetical protein
MRCTQPCTHSPASHTNTVHTHNPAPQTHTNTKPCTLTSPCTAYIHSPTHSPALHTHTALCYSPGSGGGAHAELVHVRAANEDRASLQHRLHAGRRVRRCVAAKHVRRGAAPRPRHAEVVLDREGNAWMGLRWDRGGGQVFAVACGAWRVARDKGARGRREH